MTRSDAPAPKGRGAGLNPMNRFEATRHELELEQVADDEDYLAALNRPPTEYLPDRSRTIIARNDSPDVGFEFSVNPYRGCEHGCIYCLMPPKEPTRLSAEIVAVSRPRSRGYRTRFPSFFSVQ